MAHLACLSIAVINREVISRIIYCDVLGQINCHPPNKKNPILSHRLRCERNITFCGIFTQLDHCRRAEPPLLENEAHSKIFMFAKFAPRGRQLISFDFLNKVFRLDAYLLFSFWFSLRRWGKSNPILCVCKQIAQLPNKMKVHLYLKPTHIWEQTHTRTLFHTVKAINYFGIRFKSYLGISWASAYKTRLARSKSGILTCTRVRDWASDLL